MQIVPAAIAMFDRRMVLLYIDCPFLILLRLTILIIIAATISTTPKTNIPIMAKPIHNKIKSANRSEKTTSISPLFVHYRITICLFPDQNTSFPSQSELRA